MGYTTDFQGAFRLNRKLTAADAAFLERLSDSRRMARKLPPKFGVEGEFYVADEESDSVIDHNRPPSTQPGLWCQWVPTENLKGIEWNGAEKFYAYAEWLTYLIDRVLTPRGYTLSGSVRWRGEDFEDIGTLSVVEGKVVVEEGRF